MKTKVFLKWGVCLVAGLSLVAVVSPHHRQKIIAYAVDEIPSLYPLYQQSRQYSSGTALDLPGQDDMILALSTPKYNKQGNSRVYLIGKQEYEYKVIAQTPPLPKHPDPQSVTAYGGELIVANHQGVDDSIIIYDLKAAFSGELKVIGHIRNLPSPTSVMMKDGRLYITCYGRHNMRGQGVYIYEKGQDGAWQQVQRYLYRDLFGRSLLSNDYMQWPDLAPIAMAIKDNIAYISNQHSGSIMLVDLGKSPEKALIGRIKGPDSRVYYPLGIGFDKDRLYVAEHIYGYVQEFPLTPKVGDVRPARIFSDQNHEMTPYDILVKDGTVFVASLTPSLLYVFHVGEDHSREPAAIMLPDGASITSLANVNSTVPAMAAQAVAHNAAH